MEIFHKGNRQLGHFHESELTVSCHKNEKQLPSMNYDDRTLNIINWIRFRHGGALNVNSAGRSKMKNASLDGSATNSYHLITDVRPVQATDISDVNGNNKKLKETISLYLPELIALGLTGVGFYTNFCHVDCGQRSRTNAGNVTVWAMKGVSTPDNALKDWMVKNFKDIKPAFPASAFYDIMRLSMTPQSYRWNNAPIMEAFAKYPKLI